MTRDKLENVCFIVSLPLGHAFSFWLISIHHYFKTPSILDASYDFESDAAFLGFGFWLLLAALSFLLIYEMSDTPIECTSEDGVTIGLIDAIITCSRVADERIRRLEGDISKPVIDALSDLFSCDGIRYLMSLGGCFTYVPSKEFLEIENDVLKLALKGLLDRHCDGSEESAWAEWDLAKTVLKDGAQ